MNVRYRIELSQAEREALTTMLSGGKHAVRKLKLEPRYCWQRRRRQQAMTRLPARWRLAARRCIGPSGASWKAIWSEALSEEPRPGAKRKLTGKEEALLGGNGLRKSSGGSRPLDPGAAGRCDRPGSLSIRACRTRRFVAGWPKNDIKPWRKDMWCIPHVDGEYVATHGRRCSTSMPNRPISSGRWSASTKARPNSSARSASQSRLAPKASSNATVIARYRRNGTLVNLFVVIDVHRPWRKVKVTERRAAEDYAQCMRELLSMSIIPMPSTSALCRITCRPTRPAPSTKRSRPPKPGASCAAWSSTTPPSMRQLAQHGRDRNRRLAWPMPGPQNR